MIDDPELREIFAAEAEEYLHRLEAGLLRLDAGERDPELVDDVFRQAHSLKGAARMLGVRSVEGVTHELEGRLAPVRRGRRALSRPEASLMLGSLDALRRLVREAVAGEAAGVDVEALIAALASGGGEEEPPTAPAPDPAPAGAAPPPAPVPAPAPEPEPERELLRVERRRLDLLLEEAGELVLMRTRLARRLAEAEALVEALEAAGDPKARVALDRAAAIVAALREDLHGLSRTVDALEEGLREARLVPAETVFRPFPRMVRELALEQGREVDFRLRGSDVLADRRVLEELRDPLVHLLRNSVDHGLESPEERRRAGKPERGLLFLSALRGQGELVLEIQDDGRGLDTEGLRHAARRQGLHPEEYLEGMTEGQLHRLAFVPGLSTRDAVTQLSGRGVGLSIVRERVRRLRGRVEVESRPGHGTRFRLVVPVSLTTMRALLVRVGDATCALPLDGVVAARLVDPGEAWYLDGAPAVTHGEEPARIVRLDALLGVPARKPGADDPWPTVFVLGPEGLVGLLVDEVLEDGELVMKPLGPLLEGLPHLSGAAPLPDGDIAMVLNLATLAEAAAQPGAAGVEVRAAPAPGRRILLVEDSLATRVQLQRILEAAGYRVATAVDGQEGAERLEREEFDAVLSDVEMPRLDGFGLAARIRGNPRWEGLPVVLLTSLATEEDQRRGLEVGADAYLTKQAFHHELLLTTLRRLL